MSLSMLRIVKNGEGVARVVTRGPQTIRGPANIYHLFFFVFTFPQERFLARGGGGILSLVFTHEINNFSI